MNDIVFGGTFDPIHIGHLRIAQEALERFGAKRIVFVPAWKNPLKHRGASASAENRVSMIRAAIRENESFELSTLEVDRGAVSYTVDTVETMLSQGILTGKPGLLIGGDNCQELKAWKNIDRLADAVHFIVAGRVGDGDWAGQDGIRLERMFQTLVPVSSTEIRDMIAERRSIRYLVPDSVHAYIESNGLYR